MNSAAYIAEIESVQELKAMGYDQIVLMEGIQNNIRLINARIAELSQDEPTPLQSD